MRSRVFSPGRDRAPRVLTARRRCHYLVKQHNRAAENNAGVLGVVTGHEMSGKVKAGLMGAFPFASARRSRRMPAAHNIYMHI